MWAQALSRRGLWTRALSGNDMSRPYIIAQKMTMPRLWVGSEILAEFAKSKQSDGYERPTQLKRRSNMAIYLKIEMRRAKRRNGAAYQHRRRRSLAGGHAAITHGRRMEYHRPHSMLLTHSIARLTATSWSVIVPRCPGNGREPPMGTVINPQRVWMQDPDVCFSFWIVIQKQPKVQHLNSHSVGQ